MELSFSKINGTNANLNYDVLKESIIEKLGEKLSPSDLEKAYKLANDYLAKQKS